MKTQSWNDAIEAAARIADERYEEAARIESEEVRGYLMRQAASIEREIRALRQPSTEGASPQ